MTYQQALNYYGVPQAQTVTDLRAAYEQKKHRKANGDLADSFEEWLCYEAEDSAHCEAHDL